MQHKCSPAAIKVLEERYLLRDKDGKLIETVEQLFRRNAKAVAKNPEDEEAFFEAMMNLDFLPNSPCLANAGKDGGQLSACFVLPVEDDLDAIFEAVKRAALIHKTGGGTGFSFSRLRPAGSLVKSSGHSASGPVSFMEVFDAATNAIKQGGMRRGANMGILRIDHPDIQTFIHCKDAGSRINNFNISVAVTDGFMKAKDAGGQFSLMDPQTKKHAGRLDAEAVWNEIAESAWKTGDPGMWFIDRVNAGRGNPVPYHSEVESCNPCGEQELYPNDACTLGSINLANFYSAATQNYDYDFVDYQRLATVTRLAVRFLDATLDVNHFPLQEIEQVVKSIRRIGLGVMGWHDLLMKLRIPYDSQQALDIAESVMQTIWETAWDESHQLAGKYGPFPLWWGSIHAKEREYRNSTVTTIAPTGTISLIAGCSSGIEPLFAFEFKHNGLEGKLTETIRHPFADLRDKEIEEFGEARVYKQANEISPEWHLKHQAAFQKFTDNAVSKTVNLPKSATVEDIKHIYQMAWDLGCKGVTVYRDGCRDTQVLERAEGGRVVSGMETEPRIIRSDGVDYTDAKLGKDVTYAFTPRPKVLPSVTIKQDSPVGNIYVTISEHNGEPCEVFTNAGKAGSDAQAMAEAASRTASKWMRDNPFSERRRILGLVAEQWSGIGGSTSSGFGANRVLSIPDAMSKAVERYLAREDRELLPITPTDVSPYPEVREAMPTSQNNPPQASLCPACHGLTMVREEGCMHCVACGESRC